MRRRSAKPRIIKVGDLVEFQLGVRLVTAEVIEDRGPIGVNGRQLVGVAMTLEGEREIFGMPAEELTLVKAAAAKRS